MKKRHRVRIDDRETSLTYDSTNYCGVLYTEPNGTIHCFPIPLYVGDRSFLERESWYQVLT